VGIGCLQESQDGLLAARDRDPQIHQREMMIEANETETRKVGKRHGTSRRTLPGE